MRQGWFGAISIAVPTLLAAQTGRGSYARIAVLRPTDGKTVEFEAGYLRHLEWHKQAGDPWTWYGWTIWSGDRYRWFVYATFGHSAGSLDSAVTPAEDERDNVLNVAPHVEWVTNGVYEFLPGLSRGTGVPQATPRLEYTVVDLVSGTEKAFERALAADQAALPTETLWFRMLAGGHAPRYVRLRPRASLADLLVGSTEQPLPGSVRSLIAGTSVEIWNLRPAMSLGLGPPLDRERAWLAQTNPSPRRRGPAGVISCSCPEPATVRDQLSVISRSFVLDGPHQYLNPPSIPATVNEPGCSSVPVPAVRVGSGPSSFRSMVPARARIRPP